MTGCCRKDFSLLKSSRPCGADLEVSKRYKHFILAEWNTARHIFDLMRVISRTCRLDQMVPDLPLAGAFEEIYMLLQHIYTCKSRDSGLERLGHMESIWSSRVDGAGQARGKQASKLGTSMSLLSFHYELQDRRYSFFPIDWSFILLENPKSVYQRQVLHPSFTQN